MNETKSEICCEKCQFYWTCETKWYRSEKGEEAICCESCSFYNECLADSINNNQLKKCTGPKSVKEVKVEAKTTKDAIEIALRKLRVKKKEMVEIKILRDEHKGLFGMPGFRGAKVKVKIKEK